MGVDRRGEALFLAPLKQHDRPHPNISFAGYFSSTFVLSCYAGSIDASLAIA